MEIDSTKHRQVRVASTGGKYCGGSNVQTWNVQRTEREIRYKLERK